MFGQKNHKADSALTKIIKIDSLFNCFGVVFSGEYTPPIEIHNVAQRFTPIAADIVASEQIFVSQYNQENKATEARSGAKVLDDVKKYFSKFNRQYLGYTDKNGNRNLIIHLFDYSKKNVVKKYVGNSWKTSFLILFSDILPFEIVTYRVDLTEKKLYATF